MSAAIPVVLFVYARPDHLSRVLRCLRENQVPLLYVFADGSRGEADQANVAMVRTMLRAIDWCEVRLVERERNLGLGRNVVAGVTDVAKCHEAFIVWEDDLICVDGTYAWMVEALRRYSQDNRVMSVSAWTHPRVTPTLSGAEPYFDGRADCWVWGTYARAWRGMPLESAWQKMRAAEVRGVGRASYGADLPAMAREEERRNIWAVRWLYHHFQQGGLCLRPPWSMVEHIGFDAAATNAGNATDWINPPLRPAPPVPLEWPPVFENQNCRDLWQRSAPGGVRALARAWWRRLGRPLS